ncbi:uncharacterized protein N0V89_010060 [Didymosphaeria variabile]|uniref:RING-type domain-containing protein n=1 Tax=Didymosphaeria variabile TaxID=1932322 RepID=A0A9W8XEN5_9PLEO|nr:uncharacterized protein N0V89_010060 [Didymosphaeria variabile]KAJ4348682.1 hypothetical protein N0V89_010060 [Didymosphaeria variabile]
MADTPALPTRDHFLANQISIIQNCSICQEDFDNNKHAPARLCGSDSCNHVFGASCLTTWLKSQMPRANTCPMCRKELFVSENGEYDSEDNYAEYLDDEYDRYDDDDMYSEASDTDEEEIDSELGERIITAIMNGEPVLRRYGGDTHGGGPTNVQEVVNSGREDGRAEDEIAGARPTNLEDVNAPLHDRFNHEPEQNSRNVEKGREDDDSDPVACGEEVRNRLAEDLGEGTSFAPRNSPLVGSMEHVTPVQVNVVAQDVMGIESGNTVLDLTTKDGGSENLGEVRDEGRRLGEPLLPVREPVFPMVGDEAQLDHDEDCHSLRCWSEAANLTYKLWRELYETCVVWDSIHPFDLEIAIHKALRHSDPTRHENTFIVSTELQKVLEVARDMIRQHYKNRKYTELDCEAMKDWFQRMKTAMGWELCGEYGGSCLFQAGDKPCTGRFENGW